MTRLEYHRNTAKQNKIASQLILILSRKKEKFKVKTDMTKICYRRDLILKIKIKIKTNCIFIENNTNS